MTGYVNAVTLYSSGFEGGYWGGEGMFFVMPSFAEKATAGEREGGVFFLLCYGVFVMVIMAGGCFPMIHMVKVGWVIPSGIVVDILRKFLEDNVFKCFHLELTGVLLLWEAGICAERIGSGIQLKERRGSGYVAEDIT